MFWARGPALKLLFCLLRGPPCRCVSASAPGAVVAGQVSRNFLFLQLCCRTTGRRSGASKQWAWHPAALTAARHCLRPGGACATLSSGVVRGRVVCAGAWASATGAGYDCLVCPTPPTCPPHLHYFAPCAARRAASLAAYLCTPPASSAATTRWRARWPWRQRPWQWSDFSMPVFHFRGVRHHSVAPASALALKRSGAESSLPATCLTMP